MTHYHSNRTTANNDWSSYRGLHCEEKFTWQTDIEADVRNFLSLVLMTLNWSFQGLSKRRKAHIICARPTRFLSSPGGFNKDFSSPPATRRFANLFSCSSQRKAQTFWTQIEKRQNK